jgi:hypothetical protein
MSNEKKVPYTFRLPARLLAQLREKAGYVPVSVVIRILIEKYVAGEIEIQ